MYVYLKTQDEDATDAVDGKRALDCTLRVDPWLCNDSASNDQVLVQRRLPKV